MNLPPQPPASIFREYDIRGLAEKELSDSFSYSLGRAYGSLARERLKKQGPLTIAVGRDCRLTGEKYARALMAGLASVDCRPLDLGMVTTPMTYFSIHHLVLDGGIMVTGSHNPPEYNGFKICVGKSTLFGADIQELRQRLELSSAPATSGSTEIIDIFPAYREFLLENVRLKRGLKVVVDAGNGAASPYVGQLYRDLGCQVVELFCQADGRFPNHPADPTVAANLTDLIAAVRREGADVGIAFDGDADRIGVVNEKGGILWGDELMVLFSREVLRHFPGATIISEVKSSHRLYNDIRKHGGNGIMWKTGHSLIKAKMKETGAKLAGEMSGHIFFADRFFGFDDAIYAGARTLEILANASQPCSYLLADLPRTVNTPELRVDCPDSEKVGVIEKLRARLKGRFTVNEIDGVRVEFGDAWGLVRASNTQPVIVMRFEAETEARLSEVRSLLEAEARSAGLKV